MSAVPTANHDSTPARELAQQARELSQRVSTEVARVVVGAESITQQLLIALLSGGHVLLEGVPGVAKTTLSKVFSRLLGCQYQRVQFTPDLLPSDVTGTSIFDRNANDFVLRKGPIFTQVLLADEINRAPAKTQSALLEAMQEHQVTVDGQTIRLPLPFLVLATQNPIEQEGVYRLPEAQLDRFLMKFSLGYPTMEDELKMLEMLQHSHPIDSLEPVVSAEELVACQRACREVYVDDKVRRYIMQIVHDTRSHEDVHLGGSPRASIAMFRTSQAMASLRGRNFVLPDDVKRVAGPVLTHRMILKPESRLRKITPGSVVDEIVADIAVPSISETGIPQTQAQT